MKNRYYDPETGRFLTHDPAASDINLYAFVNNNPINYVDPLGLHVQIDDVQYQQLRVDNNGEGEQRVCRALEAAFGGHFWFENHTLTGKGWNAVWNKEPFCLDEIIYYNRDLSLSQLLGMAHIARGFRVPSMFILRGWSGLSKACVHTEARRRGFDVHDVSTDKEELLNRLVLLQPTDICVIGSHGDPWGKGVNYDDKDLPASEIQAALVSAKPGIVFFQACYSASSLATGKSDLVQAALDAGAKVVIGFSWQVPGDVSCKARDVFLREFLSNNKTILEALQAAEDILLHEGSTAADIKWYCDQSESGVDYLGMTLEKYEEHCTQLP